MSTKRKRILPLIMIADPDEEERGLMRAILKLAGFDVIEATNGSQAVKLVRECAPDLLVIDLTLSRLQGNDGVERIRREAALPKLPIVAVSTKETNAPPYRLKSSTAFLIKPIEYEQFYVLVDRFLPGRMTALARSRVLPL
jgi:two-component system cell cycle response regulator DivK